MSLADPTRAEIERLADLSRAGACGTSWQPPAADQVAKTHLLPLADLNAWSTSEPTPKVFVWQGRIPKDEVTSWGGAGGTNKTTGAHQLAICRAAGLPFLGVDLEPGKTLMVTAEDDFDRLHWMNTHICRAVGADPADLAGKLFLSSVRGQLNNELATFDHEGRIHPSPAFAELAATIQATGADLVVLDNVAHLFAGNENDRAHVTAFVNLLYSLGVTVLLIAHPNKAGDSYSGSTAWLNAIRSQLVVERPEDGLDPDARVLTVGKANYARPGEAITYRWHDFALWLDKDLPADTRAELDETIRASSDNDAFLRCLRLRNEQQRPVSESPASRTYAPRVFAQMAESKKIGIARLEAAMDRLFRIKRIERGFVGRIDRKDKEGLRECAEVSAEPAPTGCADVRRPSAPSALSHTLGTTYRSGAAHEATAPFDEDGAVG